MNPQSKADTQEAADTSPDYADNPIWKLTGATITAFGANEAGELYLHTTRGEFVIGKDDAGEICLFELERVEVRA